MTAAIATASSLRDLWIVRQDIKGNCCIDDDVYHIGASIKDLGKKWFGFSKMEILTPDELVERINRG